MATDIGKKNIAHKGSGHGAIATAPAASLLSPPAPPAPSPFMYTTQTKNVCYERRRYTIDGNGILLEGDDMDLDPPANQPAQATGGDVVTHATKRIAVMDSGSMCMTITGKPICATADTVRFNLINKRMRPAQAYGPLLEGVHFKEASGSQAKADAMNARYKRAFSPPPAKTTVVGDPVDLGTGYVVDDAVDLVLPGLIPLIWRRCYCSAGHTRAGGYGKGGWTHSFEQQLEITGDGYSYQNEEGRPIDLAPLGENGKSLHRGERLELSQQGGGYEIENLEDHLTRTFAQLPDGRIALRSIRNARGHHIDLEYEGSRLVRVIDSVGREIRVLNDAKGRVVRLEVWACASPPATRMEADATRELSTFVDYAYHPEGELASRTTAAGASRLWEYDGEHRLSKVTWENGSVFHYEYDAELGYCTRTRGADGLHDVSIRIDFEKGETVTHGTERARRYAWKNGIVTREETFTGEWSREREYDEDELLVAERRGDLERASVYDARGNLIEQTDPAGNKVRWEIVADRPVRRVDPGELHTTYSYDAFGSLVSVRYPDGVTHVYDRDREGRITAVHGPEGTIVTMRYDAHSNLVSEVSARGATTSYSFDGLGRPLEHTDGLGRKSKVRYDEMGRVVELTRADGTTVRYGYDRLGKVAKVTDGLGRTTSFDHTGTGVLARMTRPDGQIYRFHYDADERLIAIQNPRLEKYELGYDRADRVISERSFDGRTTSYRYDRADRVTRIDHPEDEWRELRWDKLDNLLEDRGADVQIHFERDALGRILKATCQDVTGKVVTQLERDHLGRIVADIQNGRAVRYEYDPNGRRSARVLPGGERTEYHYDGDNALRGVTQLMPGAEPKTLSIERDKLGRERKRATSGWILESEYDQVDRLTSQQVRTGELKSVVPKQLVGRRYGYDAEGRLSAIEDARGQRWSYVHDAIDRLGAAFKNGAREVFEYDPADSLVRLLTDLDPPGQEPRSWTRAPGGRLSATAKETFLSDARGRRIKRLERTDGKDPREHEPRGDERVTIYGWDSKNRLREVVQPDGQRVRYRYDAFGRRIQKDILPSVRGVAPESLVAEAVAASATRKVVTFLWDCDVVCEEEDTLLGKRQHVHEPGTMLPVLQLQDGEVFGVICDRLGTPKELIDEEGRVAWRADHGPYGELRGVERDPGSSEVASPFRTLGQYCDEETGLHYVRYRYFAPEHGGFLSPDPWGICGGLNLFALNGSPLQVVDPYGLVKEVDPKTINFAQRSVNRAFDTPDGKRSMQSVINDGPDQVKDFPPISVQIVNGQMVARDGNSRLLVAQQTGAPTIRVVIETGPDAARALAQRTSMNGLPMQGTPEQPTPR